MSRKRRSQLNTFTMSFLDLVSAGFGAAFFLFLIFASLPITPSGGMMGSTEFIDVEVSWKNPNQLLELIVYPPDGKALRLGEPLIEIEPLSGQLLMGIEKRPSQVNAWQAAFLTGSSAYGDTSLTDQTGERFLHFRVINPCPGEWQFALNANNRVSAQPYINAAANDKIIQIKSLKAYTSRDDPIKKSVYQSLINSISPVKLLAELIQGLRNDTLTNIQWKNPNQEDSPSVVVQTAKVAVNLNHCKLNQ